MAHERFGKLPWSSVVQPAIRLGGGFPATAGLVDSILSNSAVLMRDPESAKIYFTGGRAPRTGETFVQPDLRRTLELIARNGGQAFYAGEIADAIARAMTERGGLITKDDLSRYQAESGSPIRIQYRGYEVVSALPPAGGVEVLEALKILEGFDLARLSEADRLHVIASALRIAFADRTAYKGDPSVAKFPVAALLSPSYVERRRKDINLAEVPSSTEPGNPTDLGLGSWKPSVRELAYAGSGNTSHLVTADREGNMVSLTHTMGPRVWGSGVTIPGTGVMLNSGMSNYSTRGDSPRRLVGGSIRSSTMAPTMVLREGVPILLVGASGNAQITAAVVQIIVNVVDLGLGVQAAVAAGRVMPDEGRKLLFEPRIPQGVRDALAAKGYQLEVDTAIANSQALQIINGLYQGVTDPRSPGGAYAY